MTKIEQALQYIAEGMNTHAAAKKAGLAPTHVYQVLKRRRDKTEGRCPCCGVQLQRLEAVLVEMAKHGLYLSAVAEIRKCLPLQKPIDTQKSIVAK